MTDITFWPASETIPALQRVRVVQSGEQIIEICPESSMKGVSIWLPSIAGLEQACCVGTALTILLVALRQSDRC